MIHPDLNQLLRLARRDRPAPSLLASLARRLRVPFVVAPPAPAAVSSSATAAALPRGGAGHVEPVALPNAEKQAVKRAGALKR